MRRRCGAALLWEGLVPALRRPRRSSHVTSQLPLAEGPGPSSPSAGGHGAACSVRRLLGCGCVPGHCPQPGPWFEGHGVSVWGCSRGQARKRAPSGSLGQGAACQSCSRPTGQNWGTAQARGPEHALQRAARLQALGPARSRPVHESQEVRSGRSVDGGVRRSGSIRGESRQEVMRVRVP